MKTRDLLKKLEQNFESMVDVPRIKVGKKQTIETLINEEALLFAKFLRTERKEWKPRTDTLDLIQVIPWTRPIRISVGCSCFIHHLFRINRN